MSTVGQRIKKCRMDKKISQLRLAELIGRQQQTISSFESDLVMPSENAFQKLARVLKVHVAWLRYGPGSAKNELEAMTKQMDDLKFLFKEVDILRKQVLAIVNYLQIPRRIFNDLDMPKDSENSPTNY